MSVWACINHLQSAPAGSGQCSPKPGDDMIPMSARILICRPPHPGVLLDSHRQCHFCQKAFLLPTILGLGGNHTLTPAEKRYFLNAEAIT